MNGFKIYLCGITSAEYHNIVDMVEPVKDLIDGLIFVCDEKAVFDDTEGYLQRNCKDGKIITRPWTNDFDIQFNEILRQGNARHGKDWLILRDSKERINPEFIQELKNGLINELEEKRVVCCYQRSKPALIKFTNRLLFQQNPHCGLTGMTGAVIDLSLTEEYKDDKKWLYSLRVGDESWVTNGLKYTLWPRSNHMVLVWYEKQRFPEGTDTEKQYKEHERVRFEFLDYWFYLFNEPPTVESVTEYMKKPIETWDSQLLRYFDFELTTRNHYRWQILNEKIEDIMANQWDWTFKNLCLS